MQKITNIAITAMITITALLIAVLYILSDTNLPNNDDAERVLYNEGWQYSFNGEDFAHCETPLELIGQKADFITLKNTIPNIDEPFDSLQFHISRTLVKVYLEGELIFNIDESDLAVVGRSPGNMPLFVTLPQAEIGDEIIIELRPVYGKVDMASFYLGQESAGIYAMVSAELLNFLLSTIMVVLGLAELAFYIFVGRKNKAVHMLHISFFTLLAGLYTFTVLPMLSLVLNEPYVVSIASYLLLSLLPIPLLFFFCTAYKLKYNKHLYILILLHSIYWAVIITLQANNIVDVREPLIICHITLCATIIAIVSTAIYETAVYKNKKMREFIIGGITLCAFVVVDLITYYFAYENYMSTYFKLGVMSLSVILFLAYTSELADMIKQNAHTKIYEKLAYQDVLTLAKNRTCFENDLDNFRNGKEPLEDLVLGVFDVNNLKVINDTQGHKQGDKLIISASEAITRTFENDANIYRIGGDEFVILSTSMVAEQIPSFLNKLTVNICKVNKLAGIEFTVASALEQYDSELDSSVDDLLKRVDKKMYERKVAMKKIED